MASEKIDCPLFNHSINDSVCFDICMVAEGMAPEWTVPKEARIPGFKETCLNCRLHKD